jgi:hypothetical protein
MGGGRAAEGRLHRIGSDLSRDRHDRRPPAPQLLFGARGVPTRREPNLLMKRNDGDLPVPLEGLAEERITRARAIKLAGAAAATGAFALFWGTDEADALTRAQRRRRRRRKRLRRRRRNVTTTNNTTDNSTVNFGDSLVGTPVTEVVTIENNGPDSVTLRPEIVGDGFTLVDDGLITIAPGQTAVLPVIFNPLSGDAQTGNLKLVDVDDGLVLEDIDLLGRGLL